ncbi:MAG: prepilin peptidase [Bacteroidales bacterium]|nr:prepilin peptidase [Bacteroidales bacterium]
MPLLELIFPLLVFFWALLGLCVGSYLNVVIYRLPQKMSTAFPPSHCPGCSKPIAWYDNIPILSFLLLKGKCRHCKTEISPRYLFVEAGNRLLWLELLVYDYYTCLAGVEMVFIFWVCKETDVAWFSLLNFCYRRNLYGWISNNFSIEMLCDYFSCYFHK